MQFNWCFSKHTTVISWHAYQYLIKTTRDYNGRSADWFVLFSNRFWYFVCILCWNKVIACLKVSKTLRIKSKAVSWPTRPNMDQPVVTPDPLCVLLFAHCLPAARASRLFFEHIKHGSASKSLRLLSLLPGKLPCSHGSLQSSFYSLLSPFQKEFTWQPNLNCLPPITLWLFSLIFFFHRIYHDLTLYFISTCVFFSQPFLLLECELCWYQNFLWLVLEQDPGTE